MRRAVATSSRISVHVDSPMARPVAAEPALGLHELSLAAVPVAALGVEPGDGDVDEPLEEVALGGRRVRHSSSSSSCASK